jgi:fatty-acid desaturase
VSTVSVAEVNANLSTPAVGGPHADGSKVVPIAVEQSDGERVGPQVHPLSREGQGRSLNWVILFFMVLFHAGAIVALFFFTWSAFEVAVILWFISMCLGIGVGYHRLLTHRGYKVPKVLEYALAVCGSLALEGGPLVWVATHRIHHQLTDQHGDPHSPQEGGWWSHAGWVFHGGGLEEHPAMLARYAPDLMKDAFLMKLNKYHWVPLVTVAVKAFSHAGQLP